MASVCLSPLVAGPQVSLSTKPRDRTRLAADGLFRSTVIGLHTDASLSASAVVVDRRFAAHSSGTDLR